MTRIATTYYGADPTTQFQWATAGSDQFSRIYDLYYLAQALEYHDHSNARGLAVARVADGSLTAASYGALSVGTAALANQGVTTAKIADVAVTRAKVALQAIGTSELLPSAITNTIIADNAVTNAKILAGTIGDDRLANPKVSKSGDTISGNLVLSSGDFRVQLSGVPTQGQVFFGNGTQRIGFDGTNVHINGAKVWTQGTHGSGSGLDADLLDNHDSSYFATAASVAGIVGVPSGIIAAVSTAAQIPSGWTRFTAGDGRILIGAGTTFSQTFTENTNAGASNWTPVTGLGTDASGSTFLAASSASNNATGATNVSTSPHTHTVNGQGGAWVPPSRAVVWCQKN